MPCAAARNDAKRLEDHPGVALVDLHRFHLSIFVLLDASLAIALQAQDLLHLLRGVQGLIAFDGPHLRLCGEHAFHQFRPRIVTPMPFGGIRGFLPLVAIRKIPADRGCGGCGWGVQRAALVALLGTMDGLHFAAGPSSP